MSVAIDESEKLYPPVTYGRSGCYQQIFDSRDVQWAYQNGRMAPVTDAEVEAVVWYLKDSACNFFGTPAVSKVPEHRLRKLAKGILNAARKAVTE